MPTWEDTESHRTDEDITFNSACLVAVWAPTEATLPTSTTVACSRTSGGFPHRRNSVNSYNFLQGVIGLYRSAPTTRPTSSKKFNFSEGFRRQPRVPDNAQTLTPNVTVNARPEAIARVHKPN